MSTLKTTNLQHPSAADPAIVLDAAGDATYAGVHDFSAATVTGAPQGLVHINTTTFSAVSSVSFDNVFTSDYDNYRIMYNASGSTTLPVQFRLRALGSDNASSVYQRVRNYQGAYTQYSGESSWTFLEQDTVDAAFSAIDIFRPAKSSITMMDASGMRANTTTSAIFWEIKAFHNSTSAFDGLSIYTTSGTITGSIRVYGYKNGA